MRFTSRMFMLAALLLTCTALLFGQANTGVVVGAVLDPSGAVVPHAKLTFTSNATQFARSTTTDANGSYTMTALPPGTYTVKTEASGFAANSQQMEVTVGSRNALDIRLGVKGISEVVEVVGAGGATVNTVDQQESSVVTSQEIAQMPTLTRNIYDLVALASNATQDSVAGLGDARGAGYAINGQRSASTSILLDGGENVNLFTATVGQRVPQDSVQEFRVVSNGMTAEYGRASGGVVNVATKSGTNAFHGSLYEYNRISALASNTYDNAASGIKKPTFTRNQFGGSVGGPIVKNKLFFFDNLEFVRVRSAAAQIAQIADPAFLAAADANTQGFFTAYGKLRPDVKVIGTLNRTQLGFTPNAGGPFAALSATMPIMDTVTYNAPSDAGGGTPQNTWMDVTRVDYIMSDKTQIFGRYSSYKDLYFPGTVNTSPYVGFETGQTDYNQSVMVSITHSFTPTVLNSTRLVWSRLTQVQPLGAAPVGPTLYISNGFTGRVAGHNVAFPGYNEYTPGSAIPFGGPQNLGQFYNDLGIAHGKHNLRFGFQYVKTQDNRLFGAYEEGTESLGTGYANSFDNFLRGRLNTFQAAVYPQGKYPCLKSPTTGATIATPACTVTLPVGPPNFARSNIYNDFAVYGQDTWKLTPRLTLNLGLRWEYYGVQHNRNPNLDSNFYFGSGATIFDRIRSGSVQIAQSSPIGGLWAKQYHNFGPRIGFAYDLFGNGKTSLRGGYGIAYERNFGNVTFNVIQNPPNYAVISLSPADAANAGTTLNVTANNFGLLGGSTGSKALPVTSLRAVDPKIKPAYTEQWNLQVERQLGTNLVANATYNGARGIHQYGIGNINESGMAQLYLGDTSPNTRENTQYSNVNFRGSNGDSWYNGLSLGLRGKFKSLTATASYTWSHSIDTLSSTFSDETVGNILGYLDPFNPALDKGSSDYDARHRFSMGLIWDSPWFNKSSNGLLRQALGGFQVLPLVTIRSGYPFTMFDSTNELSPYNAMRAQIAGASVPTDTTKDTGGNLFDYFGIPVYAGQYAGPQFIPGTAIPMAATGSNLPTCTGLLHQGCSFPSNMAGRNSYRGPGNWTWDMGVYKNFKVSERINVQLRGEFFDVTNHKNFYLLGYPLGGADAGVMASSAAAQTFYIQTKKGGFGNPFDDHRNTQLALRVTF